MTKTKISKELKRLNLVSGPATLAVFDKIFPKILTEKYKEESKFIRKCWKRYKKTIRILTVK